MYLIPFYKFVSLELQGFECTASLVKSVIIPCARAVSVSLLVLCFHAPLFSVDISVKDWFLCASYIEVNYKIQLRTTRQKRYLSVTCLVLLCCYYLHSGTRI